ncbi:MAG: NTP transferase domain-containing protein [Candidatus Aenigmarchaeota archaeon]|nr:NTP transferase domain-containing protein [Candidatus Aenigmarchaeota archaeon]
MQAVILAAGLGTRLEPVTNTMSKPMIPVANKPFLQWTVEKLGNFDIIIVVRKEQKDIIDFFSERVTFVYQDMPRGTGHAILQCKDMIDDKFMVINCDEFITEEDLKKFSISEPCTLATFRHPNPERFGVFTIENNIITGVEEKPETPVGNFVNCGLYMFDKSIFSAIEKTKKSLREEIEITDAWKSMEPKAFLLSDWETVVYPWDVLTINAKILEESGSMIAESAEIRPGAYMEDPVAIGENAVIGPNCYIRKYSSIGANCKVGNAVEVKNSIVMENSFVSHLSYVGDSIVGRNCNVGAGTLFANLRLDGKNVVMDIKGEKTDSGKRKLGCIIGDNVKFAVNCVVMPGKKIWPNMLVPPCMMVTSDIREQPCLHNHRQQ